MTSTIIQKEKERQEELLFIKSTNNDIRIKEHKQSLINLREHLLVQHTRFSVMKDKYYVAREKYLIPFQFAAIGGWMENEEEDLGQDIEELNKMIERYG